MQERQFPQCHCLHERLLLIIGNGTCDPNFVYLKYRVSCCYGMINVSFRIKQNVTDTSAAFATIWFLFGVCNCIVNSDVGTGNFSLVQEILHVCGRAHL